MGNPFPVYWPENWEALGAQLARFFSWPPDAVWSLTGTEMLWWTTQANDMLAREAEARRVR